MKAIGVDVSKYEVHDIKDASGKVTSIVNWWNPDKSIKPIDFVIQRASYGGKKDEYLELLYREALKIPIRGAYHYFSTGITWKAQADNFLACVAGKDYHFYMIDYETAFNNLNGTSFAELFEIVKYVKAQTNKKVLVYFNHNVYKTYMKPFNADAIINNHDIALAWYPYLPFLNLSNPPTLPAGVSTWKVWQYGAGDVAGVSGYNEGFAYGSWRHGIDLNIFNGTVEEMRAWCGLEGGTPEPPPVEPELPVEKLEITIYDDFSVSTRKL